MASDASETDDVCKSCRGEFESGDVVQLRSGGAPLTVAFVDEDGTVHCAIVSRSGKVATRAFPAYMLELFDDE